MIMLKDFPRFTWIALSHALAYPHLAYMNYGPRRHHMMSEALYEANDIIWC